jgi:ubiquitin-activating enzyme E1-like protein 2
LDKVTKEGRPFWSLPKRPPHPIDFDPTNEVHQTFIASCACLLATVNKISIPYEKPRS